MQRHLLKSLIHNLIVTETEISGQERLMIPREIMKRAGLWPNERVEIAVGDTGARFSTYVKESPNENVIFGGAACYLGRHGHMITVMAYAWISESELPSYQFREVRMGLRNVIL